jgi:gliding motility-associated-like protein
MGCTDCPNPVVEPHDSITYTLIYSDFNDCFEMDTTVTVIVSEEFKVSIPNSFTPNGDNLNDTFFPVLYGLEEFVSMTIYNRWGMIVYETDDITLGWDGMLNGEIAAHNSVFTYKIIVRRYTRELNEFIGKVVLISP